MNVSLQRNGIDLASGDAVRPGEKITVRASDISGWSTGVVFRSWPVNNQGYYVLDHNIPAIFVNSAWIDWTAPLTEGDYVLQAFGAFNDVSQQFYFSVSKNAVAPPQGATNAGTEIATILKWVAVAAVIGGVGYFVVKSGLLEAGTQGIKRKLQSKQAVGA